MFMTTTLFEKSESLKRLPSTVLNVVSRTAFGMIGESVSFASDWELTVDTRWQRPLHPATSKIIKTAWYLTFVIDARERRS